MIIKVKNGAYEQYEFLLLKRDQTRKEAAQILSFYTRQFGDLINQVFEKKIGCIRLKKMIALCRVSINRGEAVDLDLVNARIETEMQLYQKQLAQMIEETRIAKEKKKIPAAAVQEIRRLYRKLAKQLHPDINPLTEKTPELTDLWNRIAIAFHSNDLEELAELNILASSVLQRLGAEQITVDIPDIEKKIAMLEQQINEILMTEPYTYKYILEDPAQIKEKQAELEEERSEYEAYGESLQQTLDEMLTGTGRKVTWRMSLS